MEMTKRNILQKCTIVVSSCDKYKELWQPFFYLLDLGWKDCPCDIVLNTETETYIDQKLDIKIINSNDEKMGWGGRLRNVLKQIETEYVLLLLDDFFIDGKVEDDRIKDCIKWMDEDKSISVFSFMETFSGKIDDKRYYGFEKRRMIAEYKFNCQAAIWRRKHLIQYLRKNESPWEWEVYGNWRSYRLIGRKFYSKSENAPQIIPYLFKVSDRNFGGLVLFRGKWYLPLVQMFIDKYGLDLNISNRECMGEEDLLMIMNPAKEKVNRPMWKERLLFLQPLYWKILRAYNVISHLKYLI